MSTVYITKDLSNKIASKINQMRNQELETEVPTYNKPVIAEDSQLLMQLTWGDHLHVFPQLPKTWIKSSCAQDIEVFVDEGGELKTSYRITIAGLTDYYERPCTDRRWSGPRPTCTQAWLQTKLHMQGAQAILDQLAVSELCAAINSKWEQVNKDIDLFLDRCKSLNEALRLWPALKLYIPADFIARVEHKAERQIREIPATDAIDFEGLTAAAIAAKLLGGV